jgi:DNA repair photolyase
MTFKGWEKIDQIVENSSECIPSEKISNKIFFVQAIAPIIISASRSTDIPAFYAEWFIERLKKGYVKWVNPYNQQAQFVSFAKTRVIVFWSKNPKNLIKYLPEIDARKINYYFQFTLNDYEKEKLEPNLPTLESRINTFIELSEKLGKERVIWRFDPMMLSDNLSIENLISKIEKIGDKIHNFTEKLVISFVDIDEYRKVRENLNKSGFSDYREFSNNEKKEFANQLSKLNEKWNLNIFTCAEEIDLSEYNIEKGCCIDYFLIAKIFSHNDKELRDFLNPTYQMQLSFFDPKNRAKILKDSGQRKECGCIYSKDIGQYNTCMHLCTYCYANHSKTTVRKNYEKFIRQQNSDNFSESIIPK